jgi:hypothetical protein
MNSNLYIMNCSKVLFWIFFIVRVYKSIMFRIFFLFLSSDEQDTKENLLGFSVDILSTRGLRQWTHSKLII